MKIHLLWALLCLFSLGARAQSLPSYAETFETNGEGTRYTSNTFTLSGIEYFERRAITGGLYTGNTIALSGQEGGFTWAGEGVRSTGSTLTRSSGYVVLNPIAAQNYTNIQIAVAFAAPRGGAFAGAGANSVSTTDRIRIQYSFDGGPFVTAGLLVGNNANIGDFQQDTDLDSVANATGTVLDAQFRDITVSVPATGSSLRVRVVLSSRITEVAFDNIRVTGVLSNTPKPTLAGLETGAINYTEGGAAVQLSSALAVGYSDNSATTLTGATVKIVNFQAQDLLNFTNQNGISGSYNTGNGILTMSGTATQAAYQAALRSITYSSTNTTTLNGVTRQVEFQVYNGGALSNNPSRNIAITLRLNDPAALPYTEDFETEGENTRYFASSFYSAPNQAGFFRATTGPTPNGTTSVFSNYSGSAYWFGEGTGVSLNPTAPISSIQLAPVNATGYTDLRFTLRLGRDAGSTGWFTDDYFRLYYRVNGGAWVLFGAFYGNAAAQVRRDADLDGAADATGTLLSPTLQDITFTNIPNSAAVGNLDFKLEQNTEVTEEIAFDFIRITGTSAPTVTTAAPNTITATSAVLGGNVTSDGGGPVTERGVVYLVGTGTPTTSNTKDTNGSGTGSFSETIAGLAAGTTYSVRAYAINGAGTGYGAVQTFTTQTTVTSIVQAGTNPTNASQVQYTVTFANPVTGLNVNNFGITALGTGFSGGASVASVSGSGTTYTVTVNTGSGSTYTLRLDLLNATGVSPGIGNVPFTDGQTYDIDKARPSVAISSTAGTSGSTITTTPIPFTVTFSENVTGFVAGDVTVINGSITGGTVTGTSPGAVYTFTVTPATAGTATTVAVPANVAQDAAGNFNTATSSSYSLTYQQPSATVVSVTGTTPSPTATGTVSYRVTFSGTVSGLTTSNFNLTTTGLTEAGVSSVSSVGGTNGSAYTVMVNTGTGDGTLRLNVNTGAGVTPTLSNVPYTSGTTYTITKSFAAAPTLRIQAAGSASGNADITAFVDAVQVLSGGATFANGLQNGSFETNNVAPGTFKKTADGVVATPWSFTGLSGVSRNNSGFGSTAADGDAVALVQSNPDNNASISQNLAVPTGSYQVRFRAIQRNYTALDQRLNVFVNDVFVGSIQPNNIPTYDTFTSAAFDVTAPALTATVSSTAAATDGTTATSPIPFSVSFSQSVGTSFTDADVTVTNGTVTTGSFSGSGAGPYTFTVTPTTPGTATTVSLAAGVALDANNTLNSASNAYSVTYNQPQTPAPTVTIPSNGNKTNSTPTSLGTAVVGSTVRVYIDGVQVGTAVTPDASGTWIRTYSGTPLTSGTHTVYATAQLPGQAVSAPSNTNTFTVQVPATYTSSAVTQASTARVVAGSTNQEILRVAIVIGGGPDAPISATSFTFTTTGSTTPTDISSARVYYTGTNTAFTTASPFGNATANPNGTFTITGVRQLVTGTNYFWLAYDVAANATNGNVLDATAPSFTLFDGSFSSTRNPSTPAPAGSRQIVRSSRVAGTALRFSGNATPGYVDFSASTTPAPVLNTGTGGAYSQVAWIKPAIGTGSTTYYVLGNGTGNSAAPYLYVTGNGRLGAGFGTGTAAFNVQTSPNTITADEWHYVGATYNGGTLTIYLDGENVGSVSASGTPAATRVNFVGNNAASASNNFPGDIDEVSQWNRALGQIEFRRMRHLTLTGAELNLVSYMQFNDNGSTTLDVISNATGTLTGATRVTSTAPVSSGTFNLQVVAANTTYNFPGTDVTIAFTGVTGSSETVVFRLDGQPLGTQPSATGLKKTYTSAYWIVDKYAGGSFTSANVTYTLGSTDLSADDAATPSNLKLFKRGSNSDGAFDAPISATAANAPNGTVTFPVTSFSQTVIGTFGTSPLPLPVELVRFTAERKGNDALVQWATAQELNNDYFEVESSVDGRTFRAVGRVTGHGTSNQAWEYQLTDANLTRYGHPVVYYRLRQVDTNGKTSFSAVRTVQVPNTASALTVVVFPNPAADQLTIRLSSPYAGKAQGWLLDAQGRKVQELNQQLAASTGTDIGLSVQHLPTGVYTLRLVLDGQVLHQQVVVQH